MLPKALDLTIFVGQNYRERCLNFLHYLALRRNDPNPSHGFINVHSSHLKRMLTNQYRKYLAFLIQNGVIEENASYCTNEMAPRGRFSKSYRFAHDYSWGFVPTPVDVKRIVLPAKDTTSDDPICRVLARNCCRLTLDLDALKNEPLKLQNEALELSAALRGGSANAKRGQKVGRIFHRLNKASREVRKSLRLDGKPLVEYDTKSAHPVLALSLYPERDCKEAALYQELLSGDIYSAFGIPRDEAKKHLVRFFYSKKHCIRKTGKSINPVANYFRYHFPDLFAAIVASKDLAANFQTLESSIFNDMMVPKAEELSLFYISIHDGFMCASHETGRTIRHLIGQEFHRLFGFVPELCVKAETIQRSVKAIEKVRDSGAL